MNDVTTIRLAGLYLPAAAALAMVAWRRPGRRQQLGALLASLWNVTTLALLDPVCVRLGLWEFGVDGGLLLGMPIDLLVGWSILWGALPLLAIPRAPLGLLALTLFAFDLAAMPLCQPAVVLAPGMGWWFADGVLLAACMLPGQLLGRATMARDRLYLRAFLQAVLAGLLGFVLVPLVALEQAGVPLALVAEAVAGSWGMGIVLQIVAIPLVVGLSAAQELAVRGRGTPLPLDPTARLVSSGLYAYVRNPMQLASVTFFLLLAVVPHCAPLAWGAVVCFVYSVGFAAWSEGADMQRRFGAAWGRYCEQVPAWIPRWRHPVPDGPPAKLYYASSCTPCSGLAGWLMQRDLRGVVLLPAERCAPRELWRLTYSPGDGGPDEEGVAALARALEHAHLGWALLGAIVRLPGVRHLVQLIVDASGGGPRRVPLAVGSSSRDEFTATGDGVCMDPGIG